MAIYVTGDTHGADKFGFHSVDGFVNRLNMESFPEQKFMTKEDYVIICGDFGGVWNYAGETPKEKHDLDWLDSRNFTTLFVPGNHENYDRLTGLEDKDDLFCSLVSDSLMRIMELIKEHQQLEENEAKGEILSSNHDMESERILVEVLVHEMYQNRDEMLLLVNGAQGSSLENAVDRIIDEMDAHNLHLARATCQELDIPMLEENLVHWMSHNQIDMFLYMLKHIETEEQALAFGRQAMTYLVTGWFALFGVDLSEK